MRGKPMKRNSMPGPYPVMLQVVGGYFALGDGWAVQGATEDEALANYRKAEQLHEEIMHRPEPAPKEG